MVRRYSPERESFPSRRLSRQTRGANSSTAGGGRRSLRPQGCLLSFFLLCAHTHSSSDPWFDRRRPTTLNPTTIDNQTTKGRPLTSTQCQTRSVGRSDPPRRPTQHEKCITNRTPSLQAAPRRTGDGGGAPSHTSQIPALTKRCTPSSRCMWRAPVNIPHHTHAQAPRCAVSRLMLSGHSCVPPTTRHDAVLYPCPPNMFRRTSAAP